jgi:hypothetical protein
VWKSNAYEVREIRDAFLRELANDWKAEVPPQLITALRKIFDDGRQSSLFPGQQAEQPEVLRPLAAGSTFANNCLDCVIHADSAGARVETQVTGLLARHAEEWSGFVRSLGSDSFIARWAEAAA